MTSRLFLNAINLFFLTRVNIVNKSYISTVDVPSSEMILDTLEFHKRNYFLLWGFAVLNMNSSGINLSCGLQITDPAGAR